MEVRREWDRGRPCAKRLNEIKIAQTTRSLKLRDAKVMRIDREQWRAFGNGTNRGMVLNTFDVKQTKQLTQTASNIQRESLGKLIR